MMKAKKGFTLVEILIVVVILGILAAIVIPQFTDASNEAMENSLRADLQTMRSQIELYKIQHRDQIPDTNSSAEFSAALTEKTLINGTVDAAGTCGPYMRAIPSNPFVDEALQQTIAFGTEAAYPEDGSSGWYFCTDTHDFLANSDDGTYADHSEW